MWYNVVSKVKEENKMTTNKDMFSKTPDIDDDDIKEIAEDLYGKKAGNTEVLTDTDEVFTDKPEVVDQSFEDISDEDIAEVAADVLGNK